MNRAILLEQPLTKGEILKTWWPLAAGWILMGLEQPLMSAVAARLANPSINLAAYSGIVFPIALLVEAPIIMLLSASTALSKDRYAFQKLYRFMMLLSAVLTGLHVLVAFTPLYYFVAENIIGVPQSIIEPARIGLQIMTPWTWAIAYRRFHQGILIRYGHTKLVGSSSAVRLVGIGLFLLLGVQFGVRYGAWTGVMVSTAAQSLSVVVEAAYMGILSQKVIRKQLFLEEVQEDWDWIEFFRFYVPLALTSFLSLSWQPIASIALSRMPDPVTSLAIWGVIFGFLLILRSPGLAYNETSLALLGRKQGFVQLRKVAILLSIGATLFHLVLVGLPVARGWFEVIAGLDPVYVRVAITALWLMILLPMLSVFQNWQTGILLFGKKTRVIPESMAIYLGILGLLSVIGVWWSGTKGVYIMCVVYLIALIAQAIWLLIRSRDVVQQLKTRTSEQ